MRSQVMNISQNIINPRTGTPLWADYEKRIEAALSHKSIVKYAWIIHDKDTINAKEVETHLKRLGQEYDQEHIFPDGTYTGNENERAKYISENAYLVEGNPKNIHVHLVLFFSGKNTDTSTVAKWLGIPETQIDVPKGRRGYSAETRFLDCVQYLTHEDEKQQALGKHRYSDEEIHANFDFRSALNHREEVRKKYGTDALSKKETLRMKVMQEGMTIKQALDFDPLTAADDLTKLEKLRGIYLTKFAPVPQTRINIYVSGNGGMGKGLVSRLLALALCPGLPENETYFIVGKDTGFNGYDGQPVVIYDDMRGIEMIKKFGGRGNVFNLLDTHPKRQAQNVKYSMTLPVNTFSIVNGIETPEDFISDLAGGHYEGNEWIKEEDKSQASRRIPIMIVLHPEDYEILLNHGFFGGTFALEQYVTYKRLFGNFGKARKMLDDKGFEKIGMKMLAPVVEKANEAKKIEGPQSPQNSKSEQLSLFGAELNSQEDITTMKEKMKVLRLEKCLSDDDLECLSDDELDLPF